MTDTITPTKSLDVRGEICPYPDVNTMTTLKRMKKGEILEVLVDYPSLWNACRATLRKTGTRCWPSNTKRARIIAF
jgi:TusA-related sulfurtransferase